MFNLGAELEISIESINPAPLPKALYQVLPPKTAITFSCHGSVHMIDKLQILLEVEASEIGSVLWRETERNRSLKLTGICTPAQHISLRCPGQPLVVGVEMGGGQTYFPCASCSERFKW